MKNHMYVLILEKKKFFSLNYFVQVERMNDKRQIDEKMERARKEERERKSLRFTI